MSHDAPLVSVIMNCYNSSEHLREALQSVMAQTFTDFEIVSGITAPRTKARPSPTALVSGFVISGVTIPFRWALDGILP